MSTLEIVLLIAGGLILIASFFVPFGTREADKDTQKLVEGEVKNAVSQQMDGIKGKIDDIVDETVNYAVEKTERSLERVSNEKIMAVNEYSDTVLEEIDKNHKEVMFLYDMLNDKHKNLTSAVSKVEKTVKEAEQTAISEPIFRNTKVDSDDGIMSISNQHVKQDEFVLLSPQTVSAKKVIKSRSTSKYNPSGAPSLDISFTKGSKKNGNNNERILELHNQGKSNVAIAKELGLGVGEVKLVIDLFEGQ
ncbi:MAG TPA: DUF6115 domain-containing protein [Lachnospiraceae bacterium]|nr:DUF6115 domain-containing protein [Lachnospiraceae bacterium]